MINGNELIARANKHKDMLLELKAAAQAMQEHLSALETCSGYMTRLHTACTKVLDDESLRTMLTPDQRAVLAATRQVASEIVNKYELRTGYGMTFTEAVEELAS